MKKGMRKMYRGNSEVVIREEFQRGPVSYSPLFSWVREASHVFHCVMGLMGFYWVTLGYGSWGVPQLIPQ